MNVTYTHAVASSSNNVKRYVRAVRVLHALTDMASTAHASSVVARARLTGAQWAEAQAILRAEDLL